MEKNKLFNRFKKIANKVYHYHKNAIHMLINDLKDFFEIDSNHRIDNLTDDEFKKYIDDIK